MDGEINLSERECRFVRKYIHDNVHSDKFIGAAVDFGMSIREQNNAKEFLLSVAESVLRYQALLGNLEERLIEHGAIFTAEDEES